MNFVELYIVVFIFLYLLIGTARNVKKSEEVTCVDKMIEKDLEQDWFDKDLDELDLELNNNSEESEDVKQTVTVENTGDKRQTGKYSAGYRNFQKGGQKCFTFNKRMIFCRYSVVNSPEADFCPLDTFWCVLTPDIRPFYSKNVMSYSKFSSKRGWGAGSPPLNPPL